jgi:hypothetical protein
MKKFLLVLVVLGITAAIGYLVAARNNSEDPAESDIDLEEPAAEFDPPIGVSSTR